MKNLSVEKKDNGVAVVTIDCPDSKVNKVSSGLLAEISSLLDDIGKDNTIKAMVILSGKDDNFVVGADVDELNAMKSRDEVITYITKAHTVLKRIEALPFPVVCGIHGNCLGGGLELALVTDYRIASDSPKTTLGLPEVQLGLIPAAGGTQRLPRLIGLQNALPLMLTGRNLRPKKALKIGLVDEVVMSHGMKDAAVKKALDLSAGKAAVRTKKRSLQQKVLDATLKRFIDETPMGQRIVFNQARSQVLRQTMGLYPAALAIISSVEFGLRHGVDRGLENDIRIFGQLVMDGKSKALRSLFDGMTALKKNPFKDEARQVRKIGVLGAGLMGHGIASVSTGACETILLKDVSLDAVAKGMKEIYKGLDKRARSGGITKFDRDVQYGKVIACDDYSLFGNTGIVIEAVFEDLALKRRILAEVEAATGGDTIFASNTSALPITLIAEGCTRPENVVGMHYFSPVPKMPLLEIITTDATAEWVRATALEFGIRQGKTCIVVRDCPGFYTTRILIPMLNESMKLIEEGAEIKAIDTAMKQFGYPVGPVTLVDELGIDVAAHVAKGEVKKLFDARGLKASEGYTKLFEKGYKGRKNKKGFYLYDEPKKKGLFPLKRKKGGKPVNLEVYEILGGARKPFAAEEIQDRLSLAMINEAALCLQEGILSCARDGDIGAVFGLGFPPFTGGPFQYIDAVGAKAIVEKMMRLEQRFGPLYKPADILSDMAANGTKFHKS
ncbi:MAG TPA: 3-hydroxyacyl-CoA dehydrogenase NAD-binding domain-containing protein [Deltaproteobacteria bacterium]|nr:3-hydroxyacyl-CoA dehydrogenase NAD-binding domain-containing protein [Deltaproteobacteria bacterium]HPR54274.1 3-hydroxyacyl-CoA dehydrogenase NAD-binding domain-containing protein [Deltaproteobacteria bacterium]HXK45814.1 3-hydroxyacyl-CoA dehydrogenase NAD-binding domain-containing protein [Deltaproteobacteria bacterium]